MAKFYHLDRLNTLNEGDIIDLNIYNDIKHNEGNDEISKRLQRHCDFLFPYGFSNHGESYFVQSKSSKIIRYDASEYDEQNKIWAAILSVLYDDFEKIKGVKGIIICKI